MQGFSFAKKYGMVIGEMNFRKKESTYEVDSSGCGTVSKRKRLY
jgi:hypothetical protein